MALVCVCVCACVLFFHFQKRSYQFCICLSIRFSLIVVNWFVFFTRLIKVKFNRMKKRELVKIIGCRFGNNAFSLSKTKCLFALKWIINNLSKWHKNTFVRRTTRHTLHKILKINYECNNRDWKPFNESQKWASEFVHPLTK